MFRAIIFVFEILAYSGVICDKIAICLPIVYRGFMKYGDPEQFHEMPIWHSRKDDFTSSLIV